MKKVLLSIKSTQKIDENNDGIELVTDGMYRYEDGVAEFEYQESELTGFAGTTTRFRVEGDCVTLTRDEYVAMQTEPNVAGAGGTQYYDFTAAKPGTATVTFTYARPWEATEADRTVVAEITVAEDLTVLVTSFGER